MPAAEPETSKTTSAPVSPRAAATSSPGSKTLSPSSRPNSRRLLSSSTTRARAPCGLRDERDERADRATTDDEGSLALGELATTDVVAGDRERLGQGGEAEVDGGRKRMDGEGRHGPGGLQGARSVDADELQLTADMAETTISRRLLARVERPHDDVVPRTERGDAVSDFGDRPRHLVADHHRHRHSCIHLAARDVQVGTAQSAVRDLEPDLSWTGPSQSRAPHREGARALVVDSVHPTSSHTII